MADSSSEFRAQWSEPSDIFSLLLLLGGDVIQTALATPQTPVAFSFGWVACTVSAMLASIGRASRPPSPKIASNIIDLRSGWTISNESWLLGQVVGYYDLWKPAEVDVAVRNANPSRDEEESFHSQEPKFALCIAVYKWSFEGGRQPGIPWRDWVWWSGPIVTIIQLGISAIPFALYRYWSVFLITVCGTILSYALSILPTRLQLSRRIPHRSVALTEGNGSRHVIVILGDTDGLDLFDLARNYVPNPASIKIFKFIPGVLWIALLITSTGIKTHTWFLLAVGGVGMAQNLFLAAMPRHPDALGIPSAVGNKVNGEIRKRAARFRKTHGFREQTGYADSYGI